MVAANNWKERLETDFPEIDFMAPPSTGPGWEEIIRRTCAKLQLLSKEFGVTFVANQIKEKFGTLRMYVNMQYDNDKISKHDAANLDDIAQDIIEAAELSSKYTCEVCGRPGQLQNLNGWYVVRCKRCYPKPK